VRVSERLRRGLQYGVSLALMVALLRWAFADVALGDVIVRLTDLSWGWVAALVLVTLCTLALRGWRWRVLMRPFAPSVTLWDTCLALAICYAANIAVPRSGEVLRAVSLRWTRGVSLSSVLATVVVERILDIIWLVVFLGVALLLLRGRLSAMVPGLGAVALVALAACVVLLLVLGLLSWYRDRALARLEPLLLRLPARLAARVRQLLATFISGLQALHDPASYAQIAVSSVLLEFGYVGIIWAGFASFGFPAQYGLDPGAALVIMVLSSLGVMLPTPGAAGSYHAFFSKPLVLLYAVTGSDALACATAVHALATLTYLAIGLPAFLVQRRGARARQAGTPAPPC